MRSVVRTILACVAVAAALMGHEAVAQSFPSKPIRLIVGFAAGGPTDCIARIVAQDMSQTLGQSVFVENKTGANAQIATEFVAHAEADGHTLLFASLSHLVNFLFVPNVKYHPLSALSASTQINRTTNVRMNVRPIGPSSRRRSACAPTS